MARIYLTELILFAQDKLISCAEEMNYVFIVCANATNMRYE